MLDSKDLYLRNLTMLESILSEPDQYDYLRAAAILRQLLLDSSRLIDIVNKEHRMKIRYRACDVRRDPSLQQALDHHGLMMFSVQDGLDATNLVNHEFAGEFTIDQFLGLIVGVLNGRIITVRDVIDYASNKLGGVHYDENGDDKQALLRSACESVRIDNMTVHVRQLASIIRIVLAATQELRNAVEGEQKREKGSK